MTRFTITGDINLTPDNYAADCLLAQLHHLDLTITHFTIGKTTVIQQRPHTTAAQAADETASTPTSNSKASDASDKNQSAHTADPA